MYLPINSQNEAIFHKIKIETNIYESQIVYDTIGHFCLFNLEGKHDTRYTIFEKK
jgi:hypothetical protein